MNKIFSINTPSSSAPAEFVAHLRTFASSFIFASVLSEDSMDYTCPFSVSFYESSYNDVQVTSSGNNFTIGLVVAPVLVLVRAPRTSPSRH